MHTTAMHHAQLLRRFEDVPEELRSASVDVVLVREPALGIDHVRDIQKRAFEKAVGESGLRTVVVEAAQIRTEAQNALLKLLEEPPAATQFYFVIAESSQLLPTLRSRFSKEGSDTEKQDVTDARAFIEMSVADRLSLIADKTKEKDKVWQQSLLSGLEQLATTDKALKQCLPLLYSVRTEIVAPGASVKMLLEHLALGLNELKSG